MRSLRTLWTFASVGVALLVVVAVAGAAPLSASPPVDATVGNPLAGCPPDGSGTNFPDAEVEPWVGVNPTNAANIVAIYQQDRYSNGGAKGSVAAVSFDGGATWPTHVAVPNDTRCTGGQFQRSSDPWLSFGPDGTLHAMSLVTDPDVGAAFGANGMTYNRSTNGGVSWEPAIRLVTDPVGRFLNDKNSITADPNDADFVYAVWDRLQVSEGSIQNPENVIGLGFKGPIYFTRTTNGGDSWEPARKIYETGANKQTLGNQIVVRPQGELFDFFADITNSSNRRGGIGPVKLSYIRSDDRGQTWTKPVRIDDMIPMSLIREDTPIDVEAVACPDPSDQGACPIRAGDLLPEVAVDPGNGNLVRSLDGCSLRRRPVRRRPRQHRLHHVHGRREHLVVPDQGQQDADDRAQLRPTGLHAVRACLEQWNGRGHLLRPPQQHAGSRDARYGLLRCELRLCTENCADPASWEEARITPASFNIRNAPYARGYFLGDYMGLASAGNNFAAVFGQAFTPNDANQYFSRLSP